MGQAYHVLLTVQYLSIGLLSLEAACIVYRWHTKLQGILFIGCVATPVNNAEYLMVMLVRTEREYLIPGNSSGYCRVSGAGHSDRPGKEVSRHFVDYMMLHMNGVEATEKIRALSAAGKCPAKERRSRQK